MKGNRTCTTTSFTEARSKIWSSSNISMSAPVTFLISESTLPSLPLKQPTKSDETRSLAVTGLPSLKPDRCPLPMTPSMILRKTRTTAFCAGEYVDSRFYKISSQPQINDKDDIWDCECVLCVWDPERNYYYYF
jgi:hypothetical protein